MSKLAPGQRHSMGRRLVICHLSKLIPRRARECDGGAPPMLCCFVATVFGFNVNCPMAFWSPEGFRRSVLILRLELLFNFCYGTFLVIGMNISAIE